MCRLEGAALPLLLPVSFDLHLVKMVWGDVTKMLMGDSCSHMWVPQGDRDAGKGGAVSPQRDGSSASRCDLPANEHTADSAHKRSWT